VTRVLAKLDACGLTEYVVTGSLALEAALRCAAGQQARLNDIDIVVPRYDDIPSGIGTAFLVRHVHPRRPKGKLLMQLVDPDEAVRIDIFTPNGATMARCRPAYIADFTIKIVSAEDMASRITSELRSITRGEAVRRKCAVDFGRIIAIVDQSLVESVWPEHRGINDLETFAGAVEAIQTALLVGNGRFIDSIYSRAPGMECPHCENKAPFQLTDPRVILAILGYC
jgi:hypothetical protein